MPPVKLNIALFRLHVGCEILTVSVAGAGLIVTEIDALSLSIPFKVWDT